jgi:hypothetical protein
LLRVRTADFPELVAHALSCENHTWFLAEDDSESIWRPARVGSETNSITLHSKAKQKTQAFQLCPLQGTKESE